MNLDDPFALRNIDVHGGLDQLMRYPEQISEVLAQRPMVSIPEDWPHGPLAYRAILIVGFGTAGAAADAVAQLARATAATPVNVQRESSLPSYVGPDTLVVVCSYSGDTPECLTAYGNAVVAGARVVCVTKGGELAKSAADSPIVSLPAHLRSEFAMPSLFFGIKGVLEQVGILEPCEEDEAQTVALMRRQRASFLPEEPQSRNAAKRLADVLNGKLPVIYAGEPHLAPVVSRWRTQINASGKLQALSNVFPEVTHTELLAWRNASKQSGRWAVIIIRDRTQSAASAARIDGAAGAVPDDIDLHEVYVEGQSLLARLWTGLYFADVTSAYLALAWGEEPSAV